MIESIGLETLNAEPLATEEISKKDIERLATPHMLNAAIPSDFIAALQKGGTTPDNFELKVRKLAPQLCYIETFSYSYV